MRPTIAAIAFVALFSLGGEARSADVDLEVILAADVSRSIDDAEFDLQRKGYAAALSDPRVLAAIHGRPGAAIGVCFIEWSGDEDQQVVVDWTEIRDEEDAGSMAAAIIAAPRSFMGRTSISAASASASSISHAAPVEPGNEVALHVRCHQGQMRELPAAVDTCLI